MIAKQGFNQLLADVLSIQPERDDLGLKLTNERIKEVVRSDSSFTDEEKIILRTSPEARLRLSIEHEKIRIKQFQSWQQENIDIGLRLAADDAGLSLKQVGDNFTLLLNPLDEKAKTWLIVVQLKENFINTLFKKAIRLVDDEGFVWVAGKIDENKEVTGYWENLQETPLQRIAEHTLIIEPI